MTPIFFFFHSDIQWFFERMLLQRFVLQFQLAFSCKTFTLVSSLAVFILN